MHKLWDSLSRATFMQGSEFDWCSRLSFMHPRPGFLSLYYTFCDIWCRGTIFSHSPPLGWTRFLFAVLIQLVLHHSDPCPSRYDLSSLGRHLCPVQRLAFVSQRSWLNFQCQSQIFKEQVLPLRARSLPLYQPSFRYSEICQPTLSWRTDSGLWLRINDKPGKTSLCYITYHHGLPWRRLRLQ